MQENIDDIIRNLAEQGYSHKEISCFLNGVNQGIGIFKDYILNAKIKISKNETDPLYVHTWNSVIDGLSVLTDQIKESAFSKE